MAQSLRRWFAGLLSLAGLITVLTLLFLAWQQQPKPPAARLTKSAAVQVDSPLPTDTATPTAEVVYIENTVFPTVTPPPTVPPTPTSAPYSGLVVSTIEPVKTGPYLNILWSPDGKKALITKQYIH